MRIAGVFLLTLLVLTGCSGNDDKSAEARVEATSTTSEKAVVLGEDALPPDISESEYVDYMGQLGFGADELTLWQVTAQRHCDDFSMPAEYAGAIAIAATAPNVYAADPVEIEDLGIRRFCSDDLAAFVEGAAVYQTVMENRDGHCAIPIAERVAALGYEYLQMTTVVCG